MIDSTHVYAHRVVSDGKQNHAMRRSGGGRNTKIRAVADAMALLSLMLTDGAAADCPAVIPLSRTQLTVAGQCVRCELRPYTSIRGSAQSSIAVLTSLCVRHPPRWPARTCI